MRSLIKIAAGTLALAAALLGQAEAALLYAPLNPGFQLLHIRLDSPTLAPLPHTRFCLDYPMECLKPPIVFRSGRVPLTPKRLLELVTVNATVNSAIRPEAHRNGVADERWRLAPPVGQCHDYAVTKRHELIARGWPAQSLLLAEVVTMWGEHHLVLVVRTKTVDLVIDNLTTEIRSWAGTNYRWVRIQTVKNPVLWAKVRERSA
jgi:predicted transglutaminase-like cysteine proteinase